MIGKTEGKEPGEESEWESSSETDIVLENELKKFADGVAMLQYGSLPNFTGNYSIDNSFWNISRCIVCLFNLEMTRENKK